MNIAVTTPTGNVGSRVVRLLVQAGVRPTLLLRDPAKLDPETRDAVDVRVGSLDDVDFVLAATQGAEALFWLIPTDETAEDPGGIIRRRGEVAARAIRENGIPRTVFMSSVGAERRQGVGFISDLGAVEEALNATGTHVTHLRAGYLFTNLLMNLDTLRQGVLPTTMPLDLPMPWVDPRDVGDVAAARLLATGGTGVQVQAVHGPKDLSFADVVRIVGEATGREVQAVAITDEEEREAMLQAGLSPAGAQGLVEMSSGLRDGFVPENLRSVVTTTPTSLGAWAYEHLRPVLAST